MTRILAMALDIQAQVTKIDISDLNRLTGSAFHQGVAAKVGPYPVAGVDDMISIRNKEGGNPFLLLLDTIMDPQNAGALIRTALCAGVDGIIVTKDRSVGLTPAVSRASAGSLEHSIIARVTNLSVTIKELKKNGIWVAGADQSASLSVFESDLSGPVAIVIGGEGKGIRPLVKRSCDFLISIPQCWKIGSLNASAAGAVVMYEAYRQRKAKKK